jgi:2-oxo-4-hydroxy-4-carboxy-5-ureidoimidazoline decarboxylase
VTVTPKRDDLLTCLRIERWAEAVASKSYSTLLGLERSAVSAATPMTPSEVDEALAAHPRIGESAHGEGAEARFSAVEQESSHSDDAALAQRLHQGNLAYEQKFGRVFLIRAAGRSREEIVSELERRTANDPAAELAEIADQLRGIALLRIRAFYGHEFEEAS